MFKIISGDFDKSALLIGEQIIENGKGMKSTKTYLYNAQSVEVLSEAQIKELIYNSDYALYVKDLQKSLKDTNIVCFEYKYKNGKSFRALSDLSTFHKIQKSSQKEIDEAKLSKADNNGCMGCLIVIVGFFIFSMIIPSSMQENNTITSLDKAGLSAVQEQNIKNTLNQCGVTTIYKIVKDSDSELEIFMDKDASVYVTLKGDKVATVDTMTDSVNLQGQPTRLPVHNIYNNGKLIGKAQDFILTEDEFQNYRVNAKMYVQSHLKSPNSAKFPARSGWDISKNKGVITVRSYVDAINGFGANIRTDFEIKYKNGKIISQKIR